MEQFTTAARWKSHERSKRREGGRTRSQKCGRVIVESEQPRQAPCTHSVVYGAALLSADDDRAGRVVDDVVADAAHDRAAHLAETARADDDHRHVLLFGHLADDLARLAAAFRPHPARYLHR